MASRGCRGLRSRGFVDDLGELVADRERSKREVALQRAVPGRDHRRCYGAGECELLTGLECGNGAGDGHRARLGDYPRQQPAEYRG